MIWRMHHVPACLLSTAAGCVGCLTSIPGHVRQCLPTTRQVSHRLGLHTSRCRQVSTRPLQHQAWLAGACSKATAHTTVGSMIELIQFVLLSRICRQVSTRPLQHQAWLMGACSKATAPTTCGRVMICICLVQVDAHETDYCCRYQHARDRTLREPKPCHVQQHNQHVVAGGSQTRRGRPCCATHL